VSQNFGKPVGHNGHVIDFSYVTLVAQQYGQHCPAMANHGAAGQKAPANPQPVKPASPAPPSQA